MMLLLWIWRLRGLFGALGAICWLFETYFVLSVRASGCNVQLFKQFSVHFG